MRDSRMAHQIDPGDTAAMNTTHIAALLAQAREITRETLGETPPVVVAEVFRILYLDADAPAIPSDVDGAPHVVH